LSYTRDDGPQDKAWWGFVNAPPQCPGLTHEVGEPTDTGFCEGSGKKFFAKIC